MPDLAEVALDAAMKAFWEDQHKNIRECVAAACAAWDSARYPLYQHYKGGLYRLIATGFDEPTLTEVVIYRSEEDGRFWVRTKLDWESNVHLEQVLVATSVPRFLLLSAENE